MANRSLIDSIVRILAVLTSIMVLGTVVALGVQGRLRDRRPVTEETVPDPAGPNPSALRFDDLDHPISVECRANLEQTPDPSLFRVIAESGANEVLAYRIQVRLLPYEGTPVDGIASIQALEPNQPTAINISVVGQPTVAVDVGTYEACRVTAIESQRRVLRAD